MPISAKICGLTTAATLDAAIGGGASHVGFVFFPPSPRNLSFEQAAALAIRVPDHVSRVGVFVDPDDEMITRAVRDARLSVIQLHQTSPERIAHLRRMTGVKTWAAVAIKMRADLDAAVRVVGAADGLLFDAKTPAGATLPGGMGVRFDWSLLSGYSSPLPWGLSGGLDAANVAEAVERTQTDLVDTSSGVEDAPGVKSVDKIAAFLQSVRQL
jgi:phosphoribosylanthranilate isomerase